ncbi:type II secretion system protein [Idiomarina sp. HP20-50]|uniref:type II secretion system protein n=1 Tax=Idiomarina sp. HP20-50 TaxID=3070813 RepID=UPI00294AA556|nr:type II secretion system protein [Idiomarina sp. HP20-50]MDV6315946.1 type II secretion system protein [Idiomarina sp. HP20-50]
MRNQKGFTLIELIIVIVVLGILAVTAAPQFINFSSDARTSTVKGLKGAVQGASQTVFGKAAIEGQLGATGTVGSIDTVYGYPAATDEDTNGLAEIAEAANLSSADWVSFINDTAGKVYFGPADLIESPTGAGDFTDVNSTTSGDQGCFVSYTNAVDADTPPVINSATNGC